MAASALAKWLINFPDQIAPDVDAIAKAAAEELAEKVRDQLPPGKLRDSVRVEERTSLDPNARGKSYLVRAGGPLTTKAGKNGAPYDYSLAREFGTVKQSANPYFWVTYRPAKTALQAKMVTSMGAVVTRVAGRNTGTP